IKRDRPSSVCKCNGSGGPIRLVNAQYLTEIVDIKILGAVKSDPAEFQRVWRLGRSSAGDLAEEPCCQVELQYTILKRDIKAAELIEGHRRWRHVCRARNG